MTLGGLDPVGWVGDAKERPGRKAAQANECTRGAMQKYASTGSFPISWVGVKTTR